MKKNLFLSGPIGCGKSTMIKNALGENAAYAGGYVTLRVLQSGELMGFDLAPASALLDAVEGVKTGRFLDFHREPKSDPGVFSSLGVELLESSLGAPYSVLDEFGGMELLIPEFQKALLEVLNSPVPCIGVFKSENASGALSKRMDMGEDYKRAYGSLRMALERDSNTEILETTGRYDENARLLVEAWVREYVRK